ncbi:ABC transporter ATP-binding protein [Jiangella muralis]|uniref:ABC transporter ATP-binding protein n=1 Tax=Jiangella muralis TaxID=702383 RepID=UPI001969A9A1|nr:ABC transporter ATP-binding protein [Jiangella muralis]
MGIEAGRCLGIVGESGCGKSLTLRSVMGLVPLGVERDLSALRVAGREVLGDGTPPPGVAMVFQDSATSLNPSMRVGSYLVRVLRRAAGHDARSAREAALLLLSEVGISHPEVHMNAFPHQLSGGLRQRTAIALALATAPAVLLCDEPTTALDVSTQARILRLLRERMDARELAMVFVSHDMGVIRQVADRVAVMYAGRIVETGSTEDVIDRPRHHYTRMLLESMPANAAPGGAFRSIPGLPPAPAAYVEGCRFASRCPHHDAGCDLPLVGLDGLSLEHRSDCVHEDDTPSREWTHARG